MEGLSSAEVINLLDMQKHPEGGYFKETFRDGASTAIYYLLEAGDCSHWHRVHGSAEIWHHYAGGPLALTVSPDGHDAEAHRLGKNMELRLKKVEPLIKDLCDVNRSYPSGKNCDDLFVCASCGQDLVPSLVWIIEPQCCC